VARRLLTDSGMFLRRCGPGAALVMIVGCGDNLAVPIDAAAAPRGQGSEATSDLVINEVAPRGDGADWVELYNRGSSTIELCDVFLTDAVDRLDHYLPLGGALPPDPCAPHPLLAGERRVVFLDNTPIVSGTPIDPEHAPFKLDVADEVHLIRTDGAVIDGLLFLYPPGPNGPAEVTLARDPDGAGLFFARAPSPGAANPATPEVQP